jgi:carotenoid cleavage dioxygenase-like enzyme
MADAAILHPHLSGLLSPVRSEDDFGMRVRGRIPDALNGAYYRNGPNPQFDPRGPYHAFIGDGMIHGFFLEPNRDGGRARYRNRWVRTPRWQAENKAGRSLFGGMGIPGDSSVADVNPGGANTNIVYHAGRLMALQEQSEPFEMDSKSFDGGGRFIATGGKFTAHPKMDPETGEMVWFGYSAGPAPLNNLVDYGVTDATGTVTRRDRFAAPYCSMIHDFIVTRNHVLFPILPLTGDVQRAMKGLPAMAWEPGKGAYVGVMKRNASVDSIRWFEMDPNYVFHPMNAWEDGSKIHCELMEYPTAPLFPNADGSPGTNSEATLTRWTIDLAGASNAVKREAIDDLHAEFPRFDERRMGLSYRHGWYVANVGAANSLVFNSIAHIDLQTGKREVRTLDPGDATGEPIFVPRSADAPEGDGYVIALVYHAAKNTSELLILNAQDIAGEPEAVLDLPRRVPAGFHGNWVAA